MEPTEKRSRPSSSRRPRRALAALLAATSAVVVRGAVSQEPVAPPPAPGEAKIVIGGVTARFAIPDCIPRKGDEASAQACKTVAEVLRNDLRFEGLFQFVPDTLFRAIPALNPDAPKFDDWKGIGASILVVTRAEVTGGELTVEAKAFFVDSGQTMLAKRYSGRADNPRVFAHQASDDIMALTQYRGVARTRIAFSSDRDANAEHRAKELYIVDYDGFNPRRVTVNGSLNILPAWTPDGRSLAYVSYRQGSPLIFLASIFEGKSVANLTAEPKDAQAFAPAISPDGKKIAFASNRRGKLDIWTANIDGSSPHRLSSGAAQDTAPVWSPTGQEIAFTSNRTGSPQIWIMDSEGLNPRRLTTVGDWNDAPAWNPSKQYSEIAYTSRLEPGHFDIAVIDLGTRQVRQITQGRGSCEYPSWAPNGRHVVFSCSRGKNWQITVSDRDGSTVQTLSTGPGSNVQPDWGPSN
jgi:TolB protein